MLEVLDGDQLRKVALLGLAPSALGWPAVGLRDVVAGLQPRPARAALKGRHYVQA